MKNGSLNSVSNGDPTLAAAAAAAAVVAAEADGPACTMRPGDAGFDECEACQ